MLITSENEGDKIVSYEVWIQTGSEKYTWRIREGIKDELVIEKVTGPAQYRSEPLDFKVTNGNRIILNP